MARLINEAMEIETGLKHNVLDHGMVRVVDYMGDDRSVVQAARVSYGEGTKTPSDDRSLIRYLMSHRHSTPFEMVDLKLHVKLPIFVARQWIRHRTASVNEYSARYSILANEFYIPETSDIQPQSKTNKQGREGALPDDVRRAMRETIRMHSANCYDLYEELHTGWPWFNEDGDRWNNGSEEPAMTISRKDADADIFLHDGEFGMARETARMVCPPNIYTEWYWKVNLHNLLHFLSLRADPHAQMEIRVYADIICKIVQQWCPHTYEAFEDYVMNAERFSAMEMEILRRIVADGKFLGVAQGSGMSVREHREFLTKLGVADA